MPTDVRQNGISLSSVLSRIELHGQNWCYLEFGRNSGFSVGQCSEIMFHVVLEGSVRVAGTSFKTIELTPGQVAIILSGEAHAVRERADSETRILDHFRQDRDPDVVPTIAVGDGGPAVAKVLSGKLRLTIPDTIARSALPGFIVVGQEPESDPAMVVHRGRAMAESGVQAGGAAHLTKLAASMLVRALACDANAAQLLQVVNARSPAERAIDLMMENPAANWSVERLGRRVGMGRSSFAAQFTAEIGRPPMEVLTERRLELAANLLKQGELKIIEVSTRIGYRSESAFSRRFSKHFGMPPGQMRQTAEQ